MKMAKVFSNIITAIDIGTTKICVLIARKLSDDQVEVLGVGRSPSYGLSKGVVVDIAKTVSSIKQAVDEAQLMAECEVESTYIGISGAHIKSFNSSGAVPIKRSAVTQEDIDTALAAAKAVPIEKGQKVLHVLPQYFMVDGQDRIENPIGLHGVRLEVVVHVITGSVASIQNLVKCCETIGLKVQDIVLEQLASADGVLSLDERQLGVGVLDMVAERQTLLFIKMVQFDLQRLSLLQVITLRTILLLGLEQILQMPSELNMNQAMLGLMMNGCRVKALRW